LHFKFYKFSLLPNTDLRFSFGDKSWVDRNFSDDQWAIIEPFVPGGRKSKRGLRSDRRKFSKWFAVVGSFWGALA